MATGTVLVFDEAKANMIEGEWNSTDTIKVALFESAYSPAVGDVAPVYAVTNEVTSAGTYTAGGTSMGTIAACVTETGGTMTFDTLEVDATWAADASNTTTAYWALVYNSVGNDAIAFVELGGPVDMVAGSLTIAWHANGVFTLA